MKVSKIFVRRAAAMAALVLVFAVPAAAQRGKWWQNDRFVKELGLTPEQSTRLEEIFQKHQPTLRQRMDSLEQAERAFDHVVETGDDKTVMSQVDVVEAARAELNKTRTMMLLRMRRSLTADQWAKFTALAQNDRNRGPRPPGRDR
ncbi:MAG: periplasmic heavy metal sensor [Acidimicrobiia bacterium]|nr:periplasmic heavy metal sensor [Acidimicrobiia bacterium]